MLQAEHNIWRYNIFSDILFSNSFGCFLLSSSKCFSFIYREFVMVCRALILYVAAGAFQEALAALREAQQPDTAAMFILACREIHAELVSSLDLDDEAIAAAVKDKLVNLPGLSPENVDAIAVVEYYGQYQRKLIHLCMDSLPSSD